MRKDFLISLVSEKNDKGEYKYASIGRVTFIIVLGIAIWVWTMGTGDIQASHMQMLYITATYNLMKKTTWFGNIKGKETEMNFEGISGKDDTPPRI